LIRLLALALLLSGCATAAAPPRFPSCPLPISVPAPAPLHPTHAQISQLEVAVELAREAERRRADACASAVAAMQRWIEGRK
jgi:hypothetical protein